MRKTSPSRRPLRHETFNYASPGFYFVTVCVQKRINLFGEIVVGDGPCAVPQMVLNDAGMMAQTVWQEMPHFYPGIQVDAFIVMPNHIHGIVILDGTGHPQGDAPTMGLSDVIHRFKSLTTTRYGYGVQQKEWTPFPGKLWQRSFYDRVIRDDDELDKIREYIWTNPVHWLEDPENIGFLKENIHAQA